MNPDDWILLAGVVSAVVCAAAKIAIIVRKGRSDYRLGLRIITVAVAGFLGLWWFTVALETVAHDPARVATGVVPASVLLWMETAHSIVDW